MDFGEKLKKFIFKVNVVVLKISMAVLVATSCGKDSGDDGTTGNPYTPPGIGWQEDEDDDEIIIPGGEEGEEEEKEDDEAPIYDENGFDKDGYDKDGYDKYGYDKDGFNVEGYNAAGFDKDGYNKAGYDIDGFDKFGYDVDGYDVNGYNLQGFDKDGYDENGYDVNGYDKSGYDVNGYDEDGYDINGYDENGYDVDGYDVNGYDEDGFDVDGYNVKGYDKDGFDKDGYNKKGYDVLGFDKDGYDKDGYDADGYNAEGYDRDGLDGDGDAPPTKKISDYTAVPDVEFPPGGSQKSVSYKLKNIIHPGLKDQAIAIAEQCAGIDWFPQFAGTYPNISDRQGDVASTFTQLSLGHTFPNDATWVLKNAEIHVNGTINYIGEGFGSLGKSSQFAEFKGLLDIFKKANYLEHREFSSEQDEIDAMQEMSELYEGIGITAGPKLDKLTQRLIDCLINAEEEDVISVLKQVGDFAAFRAWIKNEIDKGLLPIAAVVEDDEDLENLPEPLEDVPGLFECENELVAVLSPKLRTFNIAGKGRGNEIIV